MEGRERPVFVLACNTAGLASVLKLVLAIGSLHHNLRANAFNACVKVHAALTRARPVAFAADTSVKSRRRRLIAYAADVVAKVETPLYQMG
jgi:hypothetical protein